MMKRAETASLSPSAGSQQPSAKIQKVVELGYAVESKAVAARDEDRTTGALASSELREANNITTPIEGGIGRGAGAEEGTSAGGGRDQNRGAGGHLVTDDAAKALATNALIDPLTGAGRESHPIQDRIKTRIGEDLYRREGMDPVGRVLESIFVVCDGHGGDGGPAASYFSKRLLDELETHFYKFEKAQGEGHLTTLTEFEKAANEIITGVFVESDEAYREELRKNGSNPDCQGGSSGGASATVVIVFGRFVALANAGDSRAILIARNSDLKKEGSPSDLAVVNTTKDHSLDTEDTSRALENGGDLARGGSYIRVGNHLLNMTRSLGDYDFKQDPDSPVVSCEPHIRFVDASQLFSIDSLRRSKDNVGAKYLYLVAASDGLWDFILSEEELNRLELENKEGPAENEAVCKVIAPFISQEGALDTVQATKELRETAHRRSHGHRHHGRLYYDDFSVLVTSLAFYP